MTGLLRKRFKILLERIKVPRRLVRGVLHLTGQYRRGLRNAYDIRLHKFDIELNRLPAAFDGYRFLVMGDLHIDSELHIMPRVKKILAGTPAEALLLLGDYRYRLSGAPDVAMKHISRIVRQTQAEIFAVRGNHDSKAMMHDLRAMGVRVLDNQSAVIRRDGQSLWLVGVDEPHYDKEDDLPLALSDVPEEACKILLAHTAEIYAQAAACGVDFYLCGHTHGGQINIKGIGPVITNVKAPRRFARGFWRYKQMAGYTTTGVGASAVPVRFNCPPEIVLFTLRKKKTDVDANQPSDN